MSGKAKPDFLYRRVGDALLERIRRGDYGERLPTENALMEEFGASRVTVRNALNALRRGGVINGVQGRGWEIVDRPWKKRKIACVVTRYARTLTAYAPALNEINRLATENAISPLTLFEDVAADMESLTRILAKEKVDGAIVVGIMVPEKVATIAALGVPLVYLNCYSPAFSEGIMDDGFIGGRMAAEHLLARGHRRALILSNRRQDPAFAQRESGFAHHFEQNGGSVETRYQETLRGSREIVETLDVAERDGVTALFFTNGACHDYFLPFILDGEGHPRFSVVAYDDVENVDSIVQQWAEIGALAFFRALERLQAKASGEVEYSRMVKPVLKVRGSVADLSTQAARPAAATTTKNHNGAK